jgi:hypothetical protein
MELLILIVVVSSALIGYAVYVWSLVMRADFYSKSQKGLQAVVLIAVPLLGALVVHLVYRAQSQRPAASDHAFTPQEPIMDPISQGRSLNDET